MCLFSDVPQCKWLQLHYDTQSNKFPKGTRLKVLEQLTKMMRFGAIVVPDVVNAPRAQPDCERENTATPVKQRIKLSTPTSTPVKQRMRASKNSFTTPSIMTKSTSARSCLFPLSPPALQTPSSRTRPNAINKSYVCELCKIITKNYVL